MADSYQLSIKGLLNLANENVELALPSLTGVPDYSCYNVLLVAGDNVIVLPTAAKYLLILFDATNVSNVRLKNSPSDSGTLLTLSQLLLPLRVAGSIILNSDANDTKPTKVITF